MAAIIGLERIQVNESSVQLLQLRLLRLGLLQGGDVGIDFVELGSLWCDTKTMHQVGVPRIRANTVKQAAPDEGWHQQVLLTISSFQPLESPVFVP